MLYSCVAKAPKITSQPVSHNNILPGDSVVFSVQSTGTKPLNYHWQWKQFGKAGEKGGWQTLSSEDSRFQLMEDQACNAGYYQCVVSNPDGSETSQCASLTVGK